MKRQLHATMDAISFQGKSIPIDDIWTVRMHLVEQSTNGIPTATTYNIRLGGGQTPELRLGWSYTSVQKRVTKDLCEQAYRTLVDLIMDRVCPRIVQYQFSQPLPTKFGPFEISPEGVEVAGMLNAKRAPWPAITEVTMNSGFWSLNYINEQGKQRSLGSMSLDHPNGLFLPEIVYGYQKAFLGN